MFLNYKKATLTYIDGDVREPIGKGLKVVVHCCNDIGVMGAGVALSLSNKWTNVKQDYREWYKDNKTFKLGNTQFVAVEHDVIVCNMIGQHGCGFDADGNPPVRYEAITKGLRQITKRLKAHWYSRPKGSVHCPRFGSDLAGGDWNIIEKIIKTELVAKGINVTVYDWKG